MSEISSPYFLFAVSKKFLLWLSSIRVRVHLEDGARAGVASGSSPPFCNWTREAPFLVLNHTSYLDPAILLTGFPTRFVAKAGVETVPLFGSLLRDLHTVFVDRESKQLCGPVPDDNVVGRRRVERNSSWWAEYMSGGGEGCDVVSPAYREGLLCTAVL